jgi:molecular chaperone DnaK
MATSTDRVIGIDLGTTNSCVAIVEGGVPTVIPNRGGYKTTPSMVAATEAGKRLVGHIAKRQAITNAEHTVFAAKRFLGRKWGSAIVKNTEAMSPFRIAEGPHEDVRIVMREKEYSVAEISAMVLQEMKIVAEDHVGAPVTKAVITVPAYFNDNQRQATKDAGEIAGLEVIRILNEPTAAAIAYGFGKKLDKVVAVYDFGGGTFDVSILEIAGGEMFKVLATAGDTFLGGEDVDSRISDWLVEGFQEEHGVLLLQDRMALQRLKDAAEKLKIELSTQTQSEVNLPFIAQSASKEALHLQKLVTRSTIEELSNDLVMRTIDVCAQALSDAGLEKSAVDEVLLVGGMTRMPSVKRAVSEFFGREPSQGVHPDECVALGAAIQGHALVANQDMILLDVTPHALGIVTSGGHFDALIAANTTVPAQATKSFTTNRDHQTQVKIRVMQGHSERADENDLLGEFMLQGLRSAPRGEVEIEVSFEINADGIVHVRAKDPETNKEQVVEIAASSGLTREEIARMKGSASGSLDARRASEEVDAKKQETEALIAAIERLLPDVAPIVKANGRGEDALQKARVAIEQGKQAASRRDLAAMNDQSEALARIFRTFKSALAQNRK